MNFLLVAIEQIFSPTSHNHRCFNFASCALRVNNSVVDLLCCVCFGVVLFVNILLTVEEEAVREPDNYFTGRRKLPLCGLGVIIHSNGADGVTGACCCSPCNRPVVNCFGGVHFIVSFQGPRNLYTRFVDMWEDVRIHRDVDLTQALYERSPGNFNPYLVAAYTESNILAAYFNV